jgi:putative lipoic acid-binding regulatory protein
MGQSTRRAPARELLEAAHTFPGEYLIKAFGPATVPLLVLSERLSSKGNSICITLTLTAETVDEVILAYDRLHDVPGLRMIL